MVGAQASTIARLSLLKNIDGAEQNQRAKGAIGRPALRAFAHPVKLVGARGGVLGGRFNIRCGLPFPYARRGQIAEQVELATLHRSSSPCRNSAGSSPSLPCHTILSPCQIVTNPRPLPHSGSGSGLRSKL